MILPIPPDAFLRANDSNIRKDRENRLTKSLPSRRYFFRYGERVENVICRIRGCRRLFRSSRFAENP
ncbi:hypothetical protein EYC80_004188 [Monilinia laxa]|uniref:Uncharacterized protein n=1 Tax=Monilinia laxa TaxID=61186 RepID=A0A5N6KM17_MONLA|nr:hypothetical protein EYC80_004188 [Monilinia laxa]